MPHGDKQAWTREAPTETGRYWAFTVGSPGPVPVWVYWKDGRWTGKSASPYDRDYRLEPNVWWGPYVAPPDGWREAIAAALAPDADAGEVGA